MCGQRVCYAASRERTKAECGYDYYGINGGRSSQIIFQLRKSVQLLLPTDLIHLLKMWKRKYTHATFTNGIKHQNIRCLSPTQLIKRMKNRMTIVVFSAILNPVSRVSIPY